MALSNRNVSGAFTALTAFVRAQVEASGLKQGEYVSKVLKIDVAAFGKQNLSKFMQGRLRNPPDGLVPALSRACGVPEQQLWDMHADVKRGEASTPSGTPPYEPNWGDLGPIVQALPKDMLLSLQAELGARVERDRRSIMAIEWLLANRDS